MGQSLYEKEYDIKLQVREESEEKEEVMCETENEKVEELEISAKETESGKVEELMEISGKETENEKIEEEKEKKNYHMLPQEKKLFIGGLPVGISEQEVETYFGEFGNITDLVIIHDKHTRKPRGFGFVSFDSDDAVDAVLQRRFHTLRDKAVEVKRAQPRVNNNNHNRICYYAPPPPPHHHYYGGPVSVHNYGPNPYSNYYYPPGPHYYGYPSI